MDGIPNPIDIVEDAAETVAETVDTTTDAVIGALRDMNRELTDTLRLTSEGHSAGLAGISDRLAAIEAKFINAASEAAEEAAEIAEEAVDTAATVHRPPPLLLPQSPPVGPSPPAIKRRGMLGAMKKGKRRG